MKKKIKIFCFGFGQVAKYFINNLIKNNLEYKSYFFSDKSFDSDLIKDLDSSNKVLVSIPPNSWGDIVLEVFKKNFQRNSFDWVTYLSATSVYGNKNGNWVDEKTNLEPTTKRGIYRLKAEKAWIQFYKKYNLPIQIFRLSGIYSLENNAIQRLKEGKLKIVEKENHFFSRIHVEDIAEILKLSLTRFKIGEIYNISDNYPCNNKEVAEYAANLIKIDIPKKIKQQDLESEITRDFYKDSKKVNNKKMKIFFNYNLKYPTFKEGLRVIKDNIV